MSLKTFATNPRLQFLRFLFVGGLNTLIDLVILNLLLHTFANSESKVSLLIANSISASCAAVFSFVLNKHLVFRQKDASNRLMFHFIVITLLGLYLLQTVILAVSIGPLRSIAPPVDTFLHLPFTPEFYAVNGAKILATCATIIWNYTLYKKYVFKK